MEKFDVTIDRNKYIGGSDIPVIMGISSFKTRWQLLLEKAGIEESDFTGNKYTEYGNKMEPAIRDYVNELYFTNFVPDRKIVGDCRFHCDGNSGAEILEIKTTSHIYENVNDYKAYLIQLLAYMDAWGHNYGQLAVYERPDDFSLEFDPKRLQIHEINIEQYKYLLDEIKTEIERFKADLARLKENPLLSEEDFQPNELVTLSNKVLVFEKQLAQYKAIEQEYKDMKQQLYEAMLKYNVKTWETVNGYKITRVDEVKPTIETVKEFDEKAFATEYPDLYKDHCKEVEKKKSGRAGYVKISGVKV